MEIRRTANAGVLLKLDGVSILLDGVCREVKPYPVTPPQERDALLASFPDLVAFTHAHKDHYDPGYAAQYQKQTAGVLLGPKELPGCQATTEPVCVGGVTVTPIPSRHIGGAGKTVAHVSFLIEGSKRILFTGDASPRGWRRDPRASHVDVLLVPYAYANTPAAWNLTKQLDPKSVILLHMPAREDDDIGLWQAVEETAGEDSLLQILSMEQSIVL
ncbi:MAG: MBL fold metallo-hydrolase [Oscillospiraceae bacterium]|nr:MBL fold metallo-hydrolase [Oscillospiraceae bacterium]